MKTIRIGTQMYIIKDDRAETDLRLQIERASKVPTPKQAHANALRGGVTRKYPKFAEGMCAADYVRQFTMLNARQTGAGIRSGPFLSTADIKREEEWMQGFFEPLSTNPQFAQADEAIEEVLA